MSEVLQCVRDLVCLHQLAMGVLQVGFMVVYLSDTLVSGFTTAAAIQIVVSQLKFVLGQEVPGIIGPLSTIYVSQIIVVSLTDQIIEGCTCLLTRPYFIHITKSKILREGKYAHYNNTWKSIRVKLTS